METHFLQPPCDKYFAYIFPIAPIPINPIVGCFSTGASVETYRFRDILVFFFGRVCRVAQKVLGVQGAK